MALKHGRRLGPYEVVALLGVGGMGEAYRARETRLDRLVALKVLPAEVWGDPDRRERLEREARSISQLQHPNVCTLFDVGHDGRVDFLVMEPLEGETLADRLGRGPLPVDEALRVAIAIAAAVDHAHRRGIVHRDLKPGNVMLTPDGPKVLDFGLAKDPDDRWQSMGDIRALLEGISGQRLVEVEASTEIEPTPRERRPWWLVGAASLALLAAVASRFTRSTSRRPGRRPFS
jgi:serine/threonine protein kinase